MPGVRAASMMSGLPPHRRVNANDIYFEGKEQSKSGPVWNVDYWQIVGEHYLPTMGIRVLSGRGFRPGDDERGQPVALVNQAFAKKFYPGEDPVGKQLRATGNKSAPLSTIVGVVADVRQRGLETPAGTELYLPLRQMPLVTKGATRLMNVVLRTSTDPTALAGMVRGEVASLDPSLPVFNLQTMDNVLAGALARPRFLALMLGVFSGLALLLAALGIYGVMSYAVARRTHELGIRLALGAGIGSVVRLVVGQGLALAAVGVGLGVVGAVVCNLALRRVLANLLYEVGAFDLPTFAAVAVLAVLIALLACYLPARRATRVDPVIALRYE
jgi:putative ABC transport system permease protein